MQNCSVQLTHPKVTMKKDDYLSIVEVENPPPRTPVQPRTIRCLSPFGLIVDVVAGSLNHQMCNSPWHDSGLMKYGSCNAKIAAEYLALHHFWDAFLTLITDDDVRDHITSCRALSITRFDVGIIQILNCHEQIAEAEDLCNVINARIAALKALDDI